MKIQDFEGHTYNWPPSGHTPLNDDIRPRSELHVRARKLLRKIYPTQRILEEVPIPCGLYLDFFLPSVKMAVEVQGQQHFSQVEFFQSKSGFLKGQKNDQTKRNWCELNNIKLVELRYDEEDEEWKNKIVH